MFTDSPIVRGTDGGAKMSKSLGNTIDIFADEAIIRKQIMSMVTDTQRTPAHRPGPSRGVQRVPAAPVRSAPTTTRPSGTASARLAPGVSTPSACSRTVLETFAEARERRRELEARPGYVEEVLRAGAERLAPLAAETMRICHDVMGLGPVR